MFVDLITEEEYRGGKHNKLLLEKELKFTFLARFFRKCLENVRGKCFRAGSVLF